MTTAMRFERHGGEYVVTFPYDKVLVSLVKTVASFARSWSPDTRLWLVSGSHAAQLAGSMRELGYVIFGLEPTSRHRSDTPTWAQLMFQRVGHRRAEPVFNALTRVLHPDVAVTGDSELMRELIPARAELPEGAR
jgi:hypothetical protein